MLRIASAYQKLISSTILRRMAPFVSIFVVVVFQYKLFFEGRIPAHDALFSFQAFSSLYTSLLYNHEIPLWLPYYNYGVPNIFFLLYVAPSSFIVAAFGVMTGYENVIKLFYESILLEEFAYLTGIYFLSRKLYKNPIVSVFITASCSMSIFPLWQIYFDFRLYVWLPYLLYFSIKFADKGSLNYIFILGSFLILSMVGQAGYFLPMIGLCVGLFLVVYVWANNKSFRLVNFSTFSQARTRFSLIILLLLSGLFGWLQYHQFDDQTLYVPGRVFGSLTVPRDVFMSYGFSPSLLKFFEFIYAVPSNLDTRFFIGYIPLALVFYTLIAVAAKKYAPFLAVNILIISLACSQLTAVASILYEFVPGVQVYRHIGLLLGIAKLMLVFIAGFGLEHLLSRISQTRFSMRWNRWKKITFIIISAVILLAVVLLDLFFSGKLPYASNEIDFVSPQQLHYVSFAVLSLLLLFIIRRHLGVIKNLGVIIIALHSFEMLSYQNYLFSLPFTFRPAVDIALFKAKPITYQNIRARETPDEINSIDTKVNVGAIYRIHDSWLNYDPCIPRWRSEFRTNAVDNFLHAWHPAEPPQSMVWPSENDLPLLSVIGCTAPKLRFIPISNSEKMHSSQIIDINKTMFGQHYISIPFNDKNHFLGGASFSIFAKASLANSIRKFGPVNFSLISQSDREGASAKWFFYLRKTSPTKIVLAWHAWDASLAHSIDIFSNEIDIDNNVHQLGLIKEGAQYTFLFDGAPVGKFKFEYPLSIPKSNINLGGSIDKVTEPFPGTIDEVAVYDSALPTGNILKLFNDGKPADARLIGKGHLKGYWNSSNSANWSDLSGFGNNGISHNLEITPALPIQTHAQTRQEAKSYLQSNQNSDDIVLRCADNSRTPCLFLAKPSKIDTQALIKVHDMSNNKIDLKLNTNNQEGGWLIYADSWYKGWEAFVDGQKTEILEANLGFKAVRLEAGNHDVLFRFRSPAYANVVYILYMLLSSLLLISALIYFMFSISRSAGVDRKNSMVI